MFGGSNHFHSGLCCQQPQRSPQAMMETLLAVAVHQCDGRVGPSTLPLPSTYSLLSPYAQSSQSAHTSCAVPPRLAFLLYWFSTLSLVFLTSVSLWSHLFFPCNFLSSFLFSLLQTLTFSSNSRSLQTAFPNHPGSFPHADVPRPVHVVACAEAFHIVIFLSFVKIWLLV